MSTESQAQSGFARRPGFPMSFQTATARVQVTFEGTVIADSSRAMLMEEDGHQPVYYFPQDDVRMHLLDRSTHSTR